MKGNTDLNSIRQIIPAHKWPPILQRKKVWAGAALASILAVALLLLSTNDKPTMLVADGKPLVVVTDDKQVDQVISRIKDEFGKQGITIAGSKTQIAYDDSLVKPEDRAADDQEVYNILKDSLDWQADCWYINVNGKPVLYLASEEEAQQVLEGIKQYYLPNSDGQVNVEELGFVEDVQVAAGQGSVTEVRTPAAAVEAMVNGLEKIVQHKVKSGDSLWTIARDNNMTVAELKAVNPQLKGDYIKPDMLLNLVKAEPLVQVSTTFTATVTEKIPYSTIYENDSSLWKGQQRVKQAGTFGSREVTYRITRANEQEVARESLLEKLISEPISQIVIRGTKTMVASRGDGGNGVLGWPTRNTINSPYGKKRGRTIHTGMDIDGDTGDPIYSAGDGVVLEAAWKGNYGRCIIIDHGRGLSTLYGHLSKIGVTIGQSVKRGDLIGQVGSTGKSTGPHLHFEVRLNGVHQNPMRFLEQ